MQAVTAQIPCVAHTPRNVKPKKTALRRKKCTRKPFMGTCPGRSSGKPSMTLPRLHQIVEEIQRHKGMCCIAETDYLFTTEKRSYPPCHGRIVRLNVSAGTVKVIIAATVEQQNKQQIYAFTIFMNINMSNTACTTFHLWRLPSNMRKFGLHQTHFKITAH